MQANPETPGRSCAGIKKNMATRDMTALYCLLAVLSGAHAHAGSNQVENIFGLVAPEQYVTGQFRPSEHPHFISLASANIPARDRHIFLRREAARKLARLITDFRKTYPDKKIWVASAHRNFNRQRHIWEAKWSGQRPVEGRNLRLVIPDGLNRARKILEYSAIPGASRHHWGTEVDFNRLNNRYYQHGAGQTLYHWLQKNAARYGFCQPYTAGRGKGHREEKWHWSYQPLATLYQQKWRELYAMDTKKFQQQARFQGNRVAAMLAPIYQENINNQCK